MKHQFSFWRLLECQLSEEDSKVILDNACTLFKDNTRFYIPECSTHIQVIDGETEGLYGWLALNYLLGEGKTFTVMCL